MLSLCLLEKITSQYWLSCYEEIIGTSTLRCPWLPVESCISVVCPCLRCISPVMHLAPRPSVVLFSSRESSCHNQVCSLVGSNLVAGSDVVDIIVLEPRSRAVLGPKLNIYFWTKSQRPTRSINVIDRFRPNHQQTRLQTNIHTTICTTRLAS